MQTARIEKILFIAILIFFLIRSTSVFYINFEPEKLTHEYSEFIKGETSLFSDDKIYALAGWEYINGKSPDLINFEHPPLAKYMIGFSEIAFGNQAILSLIISLATLILVYYISKKTIAIFPILLLPVLILSLDKLYFRFSITSMLEIYATFFAALSVLLLISEKRKWTAPLLYIIIGLALASKWTNVFLVILPPLYYLLAGKKDQLKFYPAYLVISGLTYLSTYIVFFIAGNNISDFIALNFRILEYHQRMRFQIGAPTTFYLLLNFMTGIEGPTSIQTLWFNSGKLVGTTSPVTGLSLIDAYNPLTWPLSFSASILAVYYFLKKDRQLVVVPLAFLLLLGMATLGKTFIWYILPGLPYAFISLGYIIGKFYFESDRRWISKGALIAYVALIVVWSLYVNLPPYIKT